LELLENGLLRRTFRSVREEATDQDIWRLLSRAFRGIQKGAAEENIRRYSRKAC
jgi:hypothetical protein